MKKRRCYRKWTIFETDFLKDRWGDCSIPAIAQKLKRSVISIKNKANELKLGDMKNCGEYITFNQLFMIINGGEPIGKDFKRLEKFDFPLEYQKIVAQKIKVVYPEKFWSWFKKNKHVIDLKRTEKGDFGYEPEWVEEKRQADKRAAQYKKTKWSESEDERLLTLLKEMKYSWRELSLILRRTEGAIQRRVIDLKTPYRPLRADNYNPWNDAEIQTVKELYLKGYKSCVIAEYVARSAKAIQGLIERYKYFRNCPKKAR